MAIGCPTRRLLNVTVLRDIVEPKPSAGTNNRTGTARHTRGGEHDRPDNIRGPTRRHRVRPRRSRRQAARAICGATTRWLLARLPKDLHWSEEPANFTVVPQAARAWRSPPACCRQRSAWTRAARSQHRFNVRDHGTCGLISHHSVFPLATSLDHVGPMAGTVRDKAMVGHSVHNPTKSSETIECPLSA